MRGVAAAVMVLAMSGCSFALVRPSPRSMPREDAPDGRPGWTSCASGAWPVLDLLGGGALAGMFALAGFGKLGECESATDRASCHAAGLRYYYVAYATLPVFVIAALYGEIATQVCQARLDP